MSGPSRCSLFLLYNIIICLGSSLTLENELKSRVRIESPVTDNDDPVIVVNRANMDASDQDFIRAIQKNLPPPSDLNAAGFLSVLESKKYHPAQKQTISTAKHKWHFVSAKKRTTTPKPDFVKVSHNPTKVSPKTQFHSRRPITSNAFSTVVNRKLSGSTLNPNQQRGISNEMESFDSENPLQITDSSFKPLQPGDVVLMFHLTLWNRGTITLKVMTTHNCCFMMPKLEQTDEVNRKRVEREEIDDCQSMALVGQREYTLKANETRNVTLIFASTQLLLYQYQRKGYCEIEFISEGEKSGILASRKIEFDTALGRLHDKDSEKKTKKKKAVKHLSTAHLELKDGFYTGRLCENEKCIPVDCVQEFGGVANRFSLYRGKCLPTPYCTPNGTLFYDKQWNKCRNVNDLRLDPVTDLDEVPEVVRESQTSLTAGMERLLPVKDLRNLPHLQCDELKRVAERTWGRAFLCQKLPIVCQKCSIN